MRFGSFNWPDFFEFEDGRALCKDCESATQNLGLRGSFKLNSASSDAPIPAIEGNLINKCGDHHLEKHGTGGANEHAVFKISIENRTIGETNPVSSMADSVVFHLTDQELTKEFSEKHQELQIAFRRFWRI